jgi:hypothetical protein
MGTQESRSAGDYSAHWFSPRNKVSFRRATRFILVLPSPGSAEQAEDDRSIVSSTRVSTKAASGKRTCVAGGGISRIDANVFPGAAIDFKSQAGYDYSLHFKPCHTLDSISCDVALPARAWMFVVRTGAGCLKRCFCRFCYCGPFVARIAPTGITIFSSPGRCTNPPRKRTAMREGRALAPVSVLPVSVY